MIALVSLCLLQSILGVAGITFLTRALHGKAFEFRTILSAVGTGDVIIGSSLLLGSFLVMAIILSFARMHVYVPLNTAITFLVTILASIFIQHEKISGEELLGMVFVVLGVFLVARNWNV